jgi:hypothetical protein
VNRVGLAACLIAFWPGGAGQWGCGAVVVVANRTEGEVRFTLTPPQGKARPFAVASGDLAAIPVTGPAEIAFDVGTERRQYPVQLDAAYYFANSANGLELNEIGLGGQDRLRRPVADHPVKPPGPLAEPGPPPARVLTVKILVDQKEVAVRQAWEKRLRGRIEAASRMLDHNCRVTLKVVAVEEWQSDDTVSDLPGLLGDFERKVKAHPAQVAIGFTSQLVTDAGDRGAGVTRTALHDHILAREWRPKTEGGRTDVLLHEIGHYLGAPHSPEGDSVMRPRLGDQPQAQGNRRSGFDPVNCLIMNLVAEEVFDRGVKRFADLSPATRDRLREIYGELARTEPNDPTPGQYLRLLGGKPVTPAAP